MKVSFIYIIFSLVFISVVNSQVDFVNADKKIAETEKNKFSLENNKSALAANYNFNVVYHRCEWTVDPAVNYIKGKVLTYFQPVNPTNQVEFDLSIVLTVDSILYHDSLLTFSHLAGDILQVNFPATLIAGSLDSLSIFYQGAPTTSGFGAFVQTNHSGTPVIWTLSEPYGAKEWWPCKQTLNDKIDSVDIIVTCPSAYRVAGNGLLVSETTSGTDKTFFWKHRYPIATYLVAFAVTNYSVYSDFVPLGNDTLEILNYIYPENIGSAQPATAGTVPTMQLYDSIFTVYPFMKEKYGHAEIGGGASMEHQTMSFMSSSALNHHVISHELGHQWFGDKITCGSWEDIWLNEGFATYCTGLTYQYMFNGIYWNTWKSQNMQSITNYAFGSVFCDDTTTVGRIFDSRLSYSKGAYVLHMLRWVMGDSLFFKGIKNFITDTTLAYGFAKTPQLKVHLEAVSSLSLTEFFNDWYYGEGHPKYSVIWEQDTTNLLTVTINQTQSHSSVSFFEMPVPIRFKNNFQDTILVFNHTFSGEIFTAGLPFTADSVFFDPDLWIVSKNNNVSAVGINELQNANLLFEISPNPFENEIKILFNSAPVGEVTIQLFNILGEEIKKLHYSSLNNAAIINISDEFAEGVYLLKISDNNASTTRLLIKQ